MIDFLKENYTVADLVEIVAHLRSENGCPWDRAQTHESIRRNFLEEAYEVAEAIDQGDVGHLCEELGDVLLQVVFHACIEQEAGRFDINDVADGVCKKLIHRHPHIFSDVQVRGTEDVLQNWDEIKRAEKNQRTTHAAMEDVAKSLPQLWRAEKIQKKAAKVGFDWPDCSGALSKLEEEIAELQQAISKQGDTVEELGDLLFSAVNVARFLDIDPELALGQSTDKFVARFAHVEKEAARQGRHLSEMTLAEMDKFWEETKKVL